MVCMRTFDDCLAGLPADQRAALEKLRKTIRAAAPEAVECVSYGLAAFRCGRMLVGLGASASHCTLYLMSSATVAAHRDELAPYVTSTGSVRFAPSKPPPASLVRKLVKARLLENATLDAGTGRAKRAAARTGRIRRG